MKKVGKRLHFFATLMVALGTLHLGVLDPRAPTAGCRRPPATRSTRTASSCRPAAGSPIIFNPSFPYRLVHTVIAAYLTTALVVGAVGAWHLLQATAATPHARTMFSMAMWMAALVAPVQILVGDLHGLNTLEHQPRQSHGDGRPLRAIPTARR